MDQEQLNTQIRKFLKQVGVTSQQQIERALTDALQSGKLKGNETLPMRMTLEIPGVGLVHSVDGNIELAD